MHLDPFLRNTLLSILITTGYTARINAMNDLWNKYHQHLPLLAIPAVIAYNAYHAVVHHKNNNILDNQVTPELSQYLPTVLCKIVEDYNPGSFELMPIALEKAEDDYFIHRLAFSPDGGHLATPGHKSLLLWDLKTGKNVQKFQGHKDRVTSLALSRHYLASGNTNNTVRIWQTASSFCSRLEDAITGIRPPLRTIACYNVSDIAYSHDGKYLAYNEGGRAILYTAENRDELLLDGHRDVISRMAFSHDNKYLATGSYDHTVRLWDLIFTHDDDPVCLHIFGDIRYPIHAVAFSHNNQYLAAAGSDEAVIWDLKTNARKTTCVGGPECIHSISFNANDQYFATVSGSIDPSVRLWDPETGQELQRIDLSDIAPQIAFHPHDPDLLAVAQPNKVRFYRKRRFVKAEESKKRKREMD